MSVLGSLYGSISIDMVIACLYYHYHFPVDIPGSDNTCMNFELACFLTMAYLKYLYLSIEEWNF